MMRNMVLLGLAIGVSVSVPLYFEASSKRPQSWFGSENAAHTAPQARNGGSQVASAGLTPSGRMVELAPDARGHFLGEFKVNGRRVEALVDTGATLVAINVSTARRIGIVLKAEDYKYTVDTANGPTRAAAVNIDSLQIGRIFVEDVQAVVLDDAALTGTLMVMSFLKRLTKFQVEDGALLLVQ
jgi:aspartyl protease family protein